MSETTPHRTATDNAAHLRAAGYLVMAYSGKAKPHSSGEDSTSIPTGSWYLSGAPPRSSTKSHIVWPVEGLGSGVAYAKFLTINGQSSVVRSSEPDNLVMARAVATMQYRPSRGYWMIHALGGYLSPDQLPVVT